MRSENFENRFTNKDFIVEINLNMDFALAREIIDDHKHAVLESVVLVSGKSFVTFDGDFEQLG